MAKTTWGRKETIIWPQNRPIYTYAAIFSAMILTAVFVLWMASLSHEAVAVVLRSGLCPHFCLRHLQPDAQKRVPDALSYRPRTEAGAGDEWGCRAWKDAGARWPRHPSGALCHGTSAWERPALSRAGTELCGCPAA